MKRKKNRYSKYLKQKKMEEKTMQILINNDAFCRMIRGLYEDSYKYRHKIKEEEE